MDDSIPRCILLAGLIISGGVFSGAETAFSYCNRTRLKTLAAEGSKSAARVTAILNKYDKTIVTLLIIINILHVTAASVSAVLAIELFGDYGSVISTVALTIIVFLFSETIPKNIAKANSDAYAMAITPLIMLLSFIFTPISAVFTFIGNLLKKALRRGEKAPTMTEDELSMVIENVEEEGVLEPEESRIIRSAIEFGDLRAKDVMTARDEVVAADLSMSGDELRALILDVKYSRLPLCDGNLDNIVGVLQTSDYLSALLGNPDARSSDYIVSPFRVPPDLKLNPLFEGMTRRRTHLAVVIGIGGVTMGVVTMEDILREIVGDSFDIDDADDDGSDEADGEMTRPSSVVADRERAAI